MTRYLTALAVLALVAQVGAADNVQRLTVHKNLGYSGAREPAVIKDAKTWQALWQRLGQPAPAVDFQKHMVIDAVAVLPGSAYRYEGAVVERHKDHVLVRLHVTRADGVAMQMVTYDGALLLVDRLELPVKFGRLLD